MISYKPLRVLLAERDIKKMELKEMVEISASTLSKIGKNEFVSLAVIDKMCKVLNCQISDIIEYVPDDDAL